MFLPKMSDYLIIFDVTILIIPYSPGLPTLKTHPVRIHDLDFYPDFIFTRFFEFYKMRSILRPYSITQIIY